MLRSTFLFSCMIVLSCCSIVKGQGTDIYIASAGETIFSFGSVDAGADPLKNVVRFTPFFNFTQQVHFDFSNSFGLYSGLGVRNVGLISHTVEGYKIKECSYAIGIPVVLKIGNMKKGVNLGVGAEAELFFTWKQKIFVNDTKTKRSAWFSDNVNTFNPSLIAEVKFYKGVYVRFKYYLDDFLKYTGGLTIPTPDLTSTVKVLPDYGKSSQLMYISIGTVIAKKRLDKTTPAGTQTTSKKNADGYFYTADSEGLKAAGETIIKE